MEFCIESRTFELILIKNRLKSKRLRQNRDSLEQATKLCNEHKNTCSTHSVSEAQHFFLVFFWNHVIIEDHVRDLQKRNVVILFGTEIIVDVVYRFKQTVSVRSVRTLKNRNVRCCLFHILCHEKFLSAVQSSFSCRTLRTCVDLKTKKRNEQKTNEDEEKAEERKKATIANVKRARDFHIIIATLKMQRKVHQFLAKNILMTMKSAEIFDWFLPQTSKTAALKAIMLIAAVQRQL